MVRRSQDAELGSRPKTQPATATAAGRGGLAGHVLALQQRVGNRATAAVLQRAVTRVMSPPAPKQWYSDVTNQYYDFYAEAVTAERNWQTFFGVYSEGGGVGYEPPEIDEDDPTWDPQAIFRRRMEAARMGRRQLTGFEQLIVDWSGGFQQIQTGAGYVSIRLGRGNQPFIQSRLTNYSGARVKVDYDDICRALDNRTAVQRERLGWRILMAAMGEQVDFTRYDARTRRAVAHLLGITQLAEEHASRTPGSAEYARAGLLAVADGVHSFTEVFGRQGGLYTPSPVGGTQAMRDAAQGQRTVDDLLAGSMDTS